MHIWQHDRPSTNSRGISTTAKSLSGKLPSQRWWNRMLRGSSVNRWFNKGDHQMARIGSTADFKIDRDYYEGGW